MVMNSTEKVILVFCAITVVFLAWLIYFAVNNP
jgi:ABC-type multidrug transport system permease subunit